MILIAGNSHTAALIRAQKVTKNPVDALVFPLSPAHFENEAFSYIEDDCVHFHSESVRTRLSSNTNKESIGKEHTWGFVIGSHNAAFYGHQFWKRAAPHTTAISNLRAIPSSIMNEAAQAFIAPKLAFFSQVKSIGTDFFIVSAPPPKLTNPCFKRGISADTVIFIDNLLRKLLEDWCIDNNIKFISPPDESVDENGFLKPCYSQETTESGKKDPHHANALYGELMNEKIQDHISNRVANGATSLLKNVI